MTIARAVEVMKWVQKFSTTDEHREAFDMAISALEKQEGKGPITVETNIYDIEEIHHNCTVQVLRNSVTGDVSVGWWEEREEE